MRVLQLAKRSVTLLATVSVALTGCSDSGPDVPFNPTGTSADLEAVNAAFGSSVFASFSGLSGLFYGAYPAPLVASSVAAMDIRSRSLAGRQAAAIRSAKRLAALLPAGANKSFSASSAAIPPEIAGKTYAYSGGTYVATDRTGAPANGVRFLLYAVDPVTFVPVEPLVETGYVDITDLSGGSTQAARLQVVSGTTTYLDYTVTANSFTGRITLVGFVTDGSNRANLNLRTTVTNTGLTLTYSLDVPQRDVSIDVTLTASDFVGEGGTVGINLSMSGPNGTLSMTGQFTATGATLTVRTGGTTFATITATGGAEPVITGADGLPISDEDAAALHSIFELISEAFISFDQMTAPVTFFLEPSV
jgi:hypothetical protein